MLLNVAESTQFVNEETCMLIAILSVFGMFIGYGVLYEYVLDKMLTDNTSSLVQPLVETEVETQEAIAHF